MAVRIISRIRFKDIICNNIITSKRCLHATLKLDKNVQFCLSDIGEGIREVTLKLWHVKINDKVSQFDNICEVESDKATVTITSRYDGVIKKIYYDINDIANVGKPLVDIEIEDSVNDESVVVVETEDIKNEEEKVLTRDKSSDIVKSDDNLSEKIISDNQSSVVFNNNENEPVLWNKSLATPAVRRIAMQYNVKLSDVTATGKNNRVLKEDILAYLDNREKQSKTNLVGSSITDKCEIKPVTRIMKTMIKTMTQSNYIPTFGYSDDLDFSKLAEIRIKLLQLNDTKMTYLPFILKAISIGLFKYPILNSSLDEKFENIIYKSYHNIGIAVDSPSGLIVPNIKNVDKLSILEISKEIQRLQKSAYDGTLKPIDLTNGTFSVSNIGAVGGIQGLPLILPPEVAIIAVGRVQKLPRFDSNNQIIAKHIVNFTFSADHRIIDGATVSRFTNLVKKYLENPELLLIEL
ncbi:dihydrolipoamide branched chain transacylase E2 [Lycorma delicatula]|uniref:dihydrolipoamide branched chain transacylase E2 n=1 Tax=Lycorma delicatula TaxID=130591 RepID=UPI003F5116E8